MARVLVDVPLAHLDRPVRLPGAGLDARRRSPRGPGEGAVRRPGRRRLRRSSGSTSSEHEGRLAPLRRAVSAEPVLPPAGRAAVRAWSPPATPAPAPTCCGWRSRPARHRREAADPARPDRPGRSTPPDPAGRGRAYAHGGGLPRPRSRAGESPRAVWTALPGATGRRCWPTPPPRRSPPAAGALLCVPDARDVARVDAALTALLGAGRHVVLTADLGPAARYRAFLAVSRGAVQVVVGTRAAAFAPVHDLGLVAIWDDGDDLHAEPRAPYPHAREVLLLRAHEEGAARAARRLRRAPSRRSTCCAPAGPTSSPPTARTLRAAAPAGRRHRCHRPRAGARPARPHRPAARARRTTRSATGSRRGPVLLQTPRQGYATSLSCDSCRTPATLPGVHRPAAADRAAPAARLPLVRHRASPPGPAASAAATGCARRWWGSGAPPRRSAGRSRRCRCGPPAATGC